MNPFASVLSYSRGFSTEVFVIITIHVAFTVLFLIYAAEENPVFATPYNNIRDAAKLQENGTNFSTT
jgi:uncharacterized membrane protein required for colicin V production